MKSFSIGVFSGVMTLMVILSGQSFAQCALPGIAPGDPPQMLYCFATDADGSTIEYAPLSGAASFSLHVLVTEFPESAGYPNETEGLAIGLAHDPLILTAVSAALAGPVAAITPDFAAMTVHANGVTCGVVYSLFGFGTIDFPSATSVLSVAYSTVAAALAGDPDGVFTSISFSDELGSPPVPNDVVVGGLDAYPQTAATGLHFVPGSATPGFRRGDCNSDALGNIADAIFLLGYLFSLGTAPSCASACDANDDGTLNIADAIFLLSWLFSMGTPPPAPLSVCGSDPTPDALTCVMQPGC